MSESTKQTERPSLPLGWLVGMAWACALIAALLLSSQIHFSMIDHGHDWWRIFLWQAVLWGYWAAVSPWVLRCGRALMQPRRRPRWWPVKLFALAGVLIAVHLFVGAAALRVLQPYVPVATYTYAESFGRIWDAWVSVDLVLFGVLVAFGYGVAGFTAARRRELRESRLEAELARAQLQALRLEIQPHFLFNTLNTIAALVRRNENEKALEMLLQLSELLRSTIEHAGGPMVSLADEIDFVRRYLELQSVRFADRLAIHYRVPEECLGSRLPFLLLQPLAENAIRHGVATRAEGGSLEIAAALSNGDLILTVSDDGPGLPDGFDLESTEGVGLSNTRSRLERIYREQYASFDVRNREEGGTVVTVVIPQEHGEEAAP
jgi:signal transduction histidine kinase